MALSPKLKKFFPLLFACGFFCAVLVAQMSANGPRSAASGLGLANEKAQAYEAKFGALKLETTRGSSYNLAKVSQPIVVLNFWASWCRPCLSEFKTLTKFVDKFGPDKVLVIGINNDSEKPKKEILKVEKNLELNFESVSDPESTLAEEFFINEIPSTIVFHKGKVIHFANKEFDFMDPGFLSLIQKKLSRD